MGERRSRIVLEVVGAEDLRKVNTALLTHEKRLKSLGDAYQRLGSPVQSFAASMNQAANASQKTGRALDETERKARKVGDTMTRLVASFAFERAANGVQAAGKKVVAGLWDATMVAVNFEKAFTGVRKTLQATEPEYAALQKQLEELSLRKPVSFEDLAGIAENAAQLGVAKKNIVAFTEVVADMAVTTNLTADAASSSLARIGNILRIPQDQYRKLSDVIVALGNDGASTEKDIVGMTLRLAAAGKQLDMPAHQVVAFATALSDLGVKAEMGGTAMSKWFATVKSAVASGGSELEKIANIAGMTGVQFQAAFREDRGQAIASFFTGLDRLKQSGVNLYPVLDALGIKESRMRDAVLRLSSGHQELEKHLRNAGPAWQSSNANAEEAAKRNKTAAAEMQMFTNEVRLLAKEAGKELVPALRDILKAVRPLLETFRKLPDETQANIVKFGLLGGAAFITAGHIASIAVNVIRLKDAFKRLTIPAWLGGGGRLAGVLSNPFVAIPAVGLGLAYGIERTIGGAQERGQAAFNREVNAEMARRNQDPAYLRQRLQALKQERARIEAGMNDYANIPSKMAELRPRMEENRAALRSVYSNLSKAERAGRTSPPASVSNGSQPSTPFDTSLYGDPKGQEKARREAEKRQKAAERAAEEARRNRIDALEGNKGVLEKQLEAATKDLEARWEGFGSALNPPDPQGAQGQTAKQVARIEAISRQVDALTRQIALLQGDPATIAGLDLGLGAAGEFAGEQKRREREYLKEWQQRLADLADVEYERAKQDYGINDPRTAAKASVADAYRRGVSSESERRELDYGLSGKGAENRREREEADNARAAWLRENLPFIGGGLSRSAFSQGILSGTSARIRALQLFQQSSVFGADANAQEKELLKGTKAAQQDAIKALEKLRDGGEWVAPQLKEMGEALEETNAKIRDLGDRMAAERIEKQLQRQGWSFEDRRTALENRYRPGLGETEEQGAGREAQRLRALAKVDAEEYAAKLLTRLRLGEKGASDEDLRSARLRAEVSGRDAREYLPGYYRDRFNQTADNLRSSVNGTAVDFLRGRGGPLDAFRVAGDAVVETALTEQVKRWTDPLILSTTQQIEALRGNTVEIQNLPERLKAALSEGLGGGGVTAGGSVPGASGGRSLSAMDRLKKTNGLAAGMAAFSIFSGAQEQGLSLGGVMGGALTGLSLGGPIGAAIGGGLALLGGLFGRKKPRDPLEDSKNRDPSLYNSPGDMAYYAYRYRLHGELPSLKDAGLSVQQPPAPVINVYMDGVKTAVRTEVERDTSSASASRSNAFIDLTTPN